MSRAENVRLLGVCENWVCTPWPESPIVMSAAFELTVAVADRRPTSVGSNVTRTLQVCPAVSVVVDVQSVP